MELFGPGEPVPSYSDPVYIGGEWIVDSELVRNFSATRPQARPKRTFAKDSEWSWRDLFVDPENHQFNQTQRTEEAPVSSSYFASEAPRMTDGYRKRLMLLAFLTAIGFTAPTFIDGREGNRPTTEPSFVSGQMLRQTPTVTSVGMHEAVSPAAFVPASPVSEPIPAPVAHAEFPEARELWQPESVEQKISHMHSGDSLAIDGNAYTMGDDGFLHGN